jgi:polysaccharide export outer membrane protein
MLVFIQRVFLLIFISISTAFAGVTYKYTINPGDILAISVWKEETLQQELRVLPDGTISFPLAGETGIVQAAGQTVEAVKADLNVN